MHSTQHVLFMQTFGAFWVAFSIYWLKTKLLNILSRKPAHLISVYLITMIPFTSFLLLYFSLVDW